jgi:hypothetical protein
MEIVEHPLCCRCDRPPLAGRLCDGTVAVEQHAPVARGAGGEIVARARLIADRQRCDETLGVLLQPVSAEKLSANGLFGIQRLAGPREGDAQHAPNFSDVHELFPVE